MDITVQPGKYVVAVSGGVDSVVLLDLLMQLAGLELIVAHYDHGIRLDSAEDTQFVKHVAESYGLAFVSATGRLGQSASEEEARKHRYAFLRTVKQQTGAIAIMTAHHQDDLIETALINLIRGTGRKGLSSLRSTETLSRPLLHIPKQQLVEYAKLHKLVWREDSTNADDRYLRNYIRHQLMTKLDSKQRQQLVTLITHMAAQNREADSILDELMKAHVSAEGLDRAWFIGLPYVLSKEVIMTWLRDQTKTSLDRRRIEQIVVLAKTLTHGKLIDVDVRFQLKITAHKLALIPRER